MKPASRGARDSEEPRRERRPAWSKPVAMTVTRTSSPIDSSSTAPKMMLALRSAAEWITSAASLTSKRPSSLPPVMLRRIPVAPSIESSSSSLVIAAVAASTARFSPAEEPTPMSAEPASAMIVRTSAKSRLTRPGMVIRSVMPWTPWRRTLSASRKASRTVVRFSTVARSRSLGITISVSTTSRSRAMPSSAARIRWAPSNSNGRVTTPTVSAPISLLAISAITGAAPVPVPPPSPAVTKTMSAPLRASLMSSRDSAAAPKPICGSAPAPSPRVSSSPMFSLMSASQARSAWESVLDAMNSTPRRPASTIRLTALVPPPPTPTTLMTAR